MNKESIHSSRGVVPATHYEAQILLAFMPPKQWHRKIALAVVLVLIIVFVITSPFLNYPLPRINAFIPALETAVFICDLMTASLLFAQYTVSCSRQLLVVASGYLFTALIVIPHALTFPDAFAPTGLLGAGSQSTAWLYLVWHVGFALFVIGYALLKNVDRGTAKHQGSAVGAIGASVAIVVVLVCGLTWVIIKQESYLPRVIEPDVNFMARYLLGIGLLVLGALAIALLWWRRRSVLDLWLAVAMFAFLFEVGRLAFGNYARFSLGFYSARIYSLTTATIVLLLLLSETTKLYARLARSYRLLEHERDSKLMNVEAITASIAHEIRQPLTAIASSGNAARRFLDGAAPDLQKVRMLLDRVTSESYRASEVFESIRALFRAVDRKLQLVDLNEIALDVLGSFREELLDHGVTTRTELTAELPAVEGDKSQLRQVLFNLIRNSVQAMDTIQNRSRMLLVRTELRETNAIRVAIEDSGPGIDPNQLDTIFDAFVTTKSHGMGLGLAICRTIIEKHGGELSARSDGKHGAQFQFILPIHTSN